VVPRGLVSRIARAWLRHGKAEEGLAEAEAYFASGHDLLHAAQLRGLVYLPLNRPTEALKDLDQAISLGDKRPVNYFARGRCHELSGNQAAAIKDYQEAALSKA
jgi:tetratricopeptide (TPR) repeat protein